MRRRRDAANWPGMPATLNARARHERRLADLEARLSAGPGPSAVMFERARLLDALGRTAQAREAYLEVLAGDASHAGALNEFGRLLDRTGFHTAAMTAFRRAVETHPNDPIGHGNLGTALLDAGDPETARRHYEIAVRLDPGNIVAHQCLAIVLLRSGDERGAAAHARIGFRSGASRWPYRGSGEAIPVLVVHSALGGNIPIDRFVDDGTFAKSTVVAEFYPPALALPPHAFVINAIGDANRCRGALEAARAFLSRTTAPIVNAPVCVERTARETTASRLSGIPGVVTPRTVVFPSAELRAPDAAARLADAGFGWPLIVRAAGFHTGRHCVLVNEPHQLAAAAASLPGDELLVIAFVDVRDTFGDVRKYRVMIVDGAIFPLHLAISQHWMVHYFSADMAEFSEHRAEEAAFLGDAPGVLGPAAGAGLNAIAQRLGLDYGGIDFALDSQRRVIVFEANATMIVPPSSAQRHSHRRAAVERIEAAVRTMLFRRGALKT